MTPQWYYMSAGEQWGPLSPAALKQLAASGQLAPTDYVWREGMPKWIRASKVAGLFSVSMPPPFQPAPPVSSSPDELDPLVGSWTPASVALPPRTVVLPPRNVPPPVKPTAFCPPRQLLGWVIHAETWTNIAIWASLFTVVSRLLHAYLRETGRAAVGSSAYQSGRVVGALTAIVFMIAVHWFLVGRRRKNVRRQSNWYWLWTALHTVWTGVIVVAACVESYVLLKVYDTAFGSLAVVFSPHVSHRFWLLVVSTVLYALAAVAWCLVLIAIPDEKRRLDR